MSGKECMMIILLLNKETYNNDEYQEDRDIFLDYCMNEELSRATEATNENWNQLLTFQLLVREATIEQIMKTNDKINYPSPMQLMNFCGDDEVDKLWTDTDKNEDQLITFALLVYEAIK